MVRVDVVLVEVAPRVLRVATEVKVDAIAVVVSADVLRVATAVTVDVVTDDIVTIEF